MLISAVGFLNVPYYPDWPGLDEFEGPSSTPRAGSTSTISAARPSRSSAPVRPRRSWSRRCSRWSRSCCSSSGSRVGAPEGRPRLHAEERARLHNPVVHRYRRPSGTGAREAALERRRLPPGHPSHTASEQAARALHRRKSSRTAPTSRAAVTPTYPFWGKRTIFSSDFYPALKQPNVELVPHAVTSITAHGIVDADGVEHDADVLVLATGFQPTNYLAHLEVVGRRGRVDPEVLGRRTAGVRRHHRARRSRTSTCSTGRGRTAVRSR